MPHMPHMPWTAHMPSGPIWNAPASSSLQYHHLCAHPCQSQCGVCTWRHACWQARALGLGKVAPLCRGRPICTGAWEGGPSVPWKVHKRWRVHCEACSMQCKAYSRRACILAGSGRSCFLVHPGQLRAFLLPSASWPDLGIPAS